MKKINLLFFAPILIEFSNEALSIQIPLIPYSLGYLLFIFISFFCLIKFDKELFFRNFFPIFLFWLGMLIGSFFSNDINKSLSISIANLPYYLGCAFFSYYFLEKKFKKVVIVSFTIVFLVNMFYLLSHTISGSSIVSYSALAQLDESIRNHHNVGFLISISAIFLSTYLLFKNKIKLSYLIFLISLVLLVISESRSNLLFSILSFLVTIYFKYKTFKFVYVILIISILTIPIINILSDYDFLSKRFSISNTEYQLNTTDDRREVLTKAPSVFYNNIFGRGNKEFRVKVGYNYIVPHNMYITTLLAGGIISFFGFFLLIFKTYKSIKFLYLINALSEYEKALASLILTIFLTFLTIDFFGFNLLLLFSICFYFNYKSFKIKT